MIAILIVSGFLKFFSAYEFETHSSFHLFTNCLFEYLVCSEQQEGATDPIQGAWYCLAHMIPVDSFQELQLQPSCMSQDPPILLPILLLGALLTHYLLPNKNLPFVSETIPTISNNSLDT